LVLTWITSRQELLEKFPELTSQDDFARRDRWPCVYVEFPTERAFYPMRPTASYGSVPISVRLSIVVYVKPDIDPTVREKREAGQLDFSEEFFVDAFLGVIDASHSTQYYQQPQFSPETPQRFTQGLPPRNIPYTQIRIDGDASLYRWDLWFPPVDSPHGFRHATRILEFTD
jgi:hypothetical protein